MRRYNILSGMNYAERQAYREERKSQIAAEKARKQASAMTCQCCGRQIFAQRGKIAHHGYERPGYGWQTASCMGALYLPFEVARERLADLITSLRNMIDDTASTIDKIKAEKVKMAFNIKIDCEMYWDQSSYRAKQRWIKDSTEFFSRAEWNVLVTEGDVMNENGIRAEWVESENNSKRQLAEPKALQVFKANLYRSYDDMLAAALREQEGRLAALYNDLELSETRFVGWKQTHTGFNKKTKEWQVKD